MWSDVLTKTLQGEVFKRMRAQLMNVSENCDDEIEQASTHPGLIPKVDKDTVTADTFEILAKAGVINPGGSKVVLGRSKKRRRASASRRVHEHTCRQLNSGLSWAVCAFKLVTIASLS